MYFRCFIKQQTRKATQVLLEVASHLAYAAV